MIQLSNLSKQNWFSRLALAALLLAQPVTAQSLAEYLQTQLASQHAFTDKYDAEVWLLDKSTRLGAIVNDESLRINLLSEIHHAARRSDLQPELVLALIEVESSFNPYAISRAGAQGLMQVMPFWKNEIGRPNDNLTEVRTNLHYGCTILKYYLDRHQQNLIPALAAYNGSLGQTWYPERVLNALDRWN